MNEAELERMESYLQELLALEKQFRSVLEKQTPYAVDVTTLLQR
jgi:hypothetical protein